MRSSLNQKKIFKSCLIAFELSNVIFTEYKISNRPMKSTVGNTYLVCTYHKPVKTFPVEK